MMRCHEVEENLSEFIDGVLPDERAKLVEQHLLKCPQCREIRDSMKEIAGYMAGMERVDPPANFVESINSRLAERPSFGRSLRRMFSPVRVRLPLELAGVAAAVILIFYVAQFNLKEKAADYPVPSVPAETGMQKSEEIKETKKSRISESPSQKDEPVPSQTDMEVLESSGLSPDDPGEKRKEPERYGFSLSGEAENREGEILSEDGDRIEKPAARIIEEKVLNEESSDLASGEDKIRDRKEDLVESLALKGRIVRQPRRMDVESWRLRVAALGGKIIDIQPPGGVSNPDSASVPVIMNIGIPVKNHERFLMELDKLKNIEKISAEVTGVDGDFLKIRLVIEALSNHGTVKPEVD